MSQKFHERVGGWARRASLGLAVYLLIPDAFAGDLLQSASSLWMPATTLSLTLIVAARNSQK